MFEEIESRFEKVAPQVDFCSLRLVHERNEMLQVREDVVQPPVTTIDSGAMVTVVHRNGLGYAATSNLSEAGLKEAFERAMDWAGRTRDRLVVDFARFDMPHPAGEYITPVTRPWSDLTLQEKLDLLQRESKRLKTDSRIVDWEAGLWYTETDTLYLTNSGGRVRQHFSIINPTMSVTANHGSETQTRSFGGGHGCGYVRQGGLEVLDLTGFTDAAPRLVEEVLQLLEAPNCPTGVMDVLLAADQMILQIHESIGHPLELDRILGDERNYAGTSFVTLDMFGSYRYGSELLNITYDPTRPDEAASYAFDDDGMSATREYIIRNGILERPLGGTLSQSRAGVPGVANTRACAWNRPPIDRMANLNLEPGSSTLDEMIAATERGVYMKTNTSWSIDDSRNKFQFGCEWGQLIENGKLTTVVKSPNYRGISGTFWRNLKMVGNGHTHDVLGTPFCGKGEPNQAIRVGHASPACLFSNVEVFGGA